MDSSLHVLIQNFTGQGCCTSKETNTYFNHGSPRMWYIMVSNISTFTLLLVRKYHAFQKQDRLMSVESESNEIAKNADMMVMG